MDRVALISVSDKTGLEVLSKALVQLGFSILSTGGTARALREYGVPVTEVSDYTESPEIMEGRVKTLHPRVHGGILMRRGTSDHEQLAHIGGRPIDLVVCNLYPFKKTVEQGSAHEVVIENIDIGGPSMIRSAAKNHATVMVVVDPVDYAAVVEAYSQGDPSLSLKESLAHKAFSHTAMYDQAISNYFTQREKTAPTSNENAAPKTYLTTSYTQRAVLRYGENPHQQAAFYCDTQAPKTTFANSIEWLGDKPISYNNLVDCEAAFEAVREFERPAAVVVKHTNPCGVAESENLTTAYHQARQADATSAFGGIVALNRQIDRETAQLLAETFLECIVAPSFDSGALEVLRQKKNLRLVTLGHPAFVAPPQPWVYRPLSGGLLVQSSDIIDFGEVEDARIVTEHVPSDDELIAMNFAWKVCKHVKSNAIVLAKPSRTVGVGAGQMSRVLSTEIAIQKAGDQARGAVLASDAFFPFADGVEKAIDAGIVAVVQPGGSVRDEEVIAAANRAGISMLFTGVRHFKH